MRRLSLFFVIAGLAVGSVSRASMAEMSSDV